MRDQALLEPEDPSPPSRSARGNLLVVDDDPDHLAVICDVLREEGYRADAAADGLEALERLRAGPIPDLIVLDMLMPMMDGWAFMAELKGDANLRAIPVLVTSAGGDRVLMSAPVAAGYLAKPLDRRQLLAHVSRCLWLRRGPVDALLRRVLVVGDESTIGATLARLLARDYDVAIVRDATAAIARFEAGNHFDSILCDLEAPHAGAEALHAFLAEHAPEHTPRMVFLVGRKLTPAAASFVERVHPRCCEKPFTVKGLRELIHLLSEPPDA